MIERETKPKNNTGRNEVYLCFNSDVKHCSSCKNKVCHKIYDGTMKRGSFEFIKLFNGAKIVIVNDNIANDLMTRFSEKGNFIPGFSYFDIKKCGITVNVTKHIVTINPVLNPHDIENKEIKEFERFATFLEDVKKSAISFHFKLVDIANTYPKSLINMSNISCFLNDKNKKHYRGVLNGRDFGI